MCVCAGACHRGESGKVECLINYVRNCDWVRLLKYCKEQSKYVRAWSAQALLRLLCYTVMHSQSHARHLPMLLISSSSCASTVAFATLPATRVGASCPLRECRLKGVYHITGRGPGHRISDALPSNPSRCSTGIVCLRVRKSVGASHADSRAHVRSWSVCPIES